MQQVGDGLTNYSKNNDGFLGKAAGVAGSVHTSVGTAIGGEGVPAKPDQAASAPPPSKQ